MTGILLSEDELLSVIAEAAQTLANLIRYSSGDKADTTDVCRLAARVNDLCNELVKQK